MKSIPKPLSSRKLNVCPSQEYVNLLLFGGSLCKHWTAIVLKFPEKEVCSARTTVPFATKLYIKGRSLMADQVLQSPVTPNIYIHSKLFPTVKRIRTY